MRAKDSKGIFGRPQLPVAAKYPKMPSRKMLPILGGGAAAVVLAYVSWNVGFGQADFVSNGPLSSAHTNWEGDCGACHTPLAGLGGRSGLSSESCSTCHEKYGDDLGAYTFASHYLYRSNEFQRVATRENEVACNECHSEHLGREARITVVPDRECVSCHEVGSFATGHPEFDAVAAKVEEPLLRFPHIQHVREVMTRAQVVDVERACLYCHNALEDGRNFAPIAFDRHCDACHLTEGIATPRLPIASEDSLGVETLSMLQQRRRPGTSWVSFANPGEYRERGNGVQKRPLHHRDPWLTENLRRLRQMLYPNAGLADLLVASPDAAPHETLTLYREAISTLRERALELRSTPNEGVQDQLELMERLLAQIERSLDDPLTPLDETRFMTDLLEQDPELTAAEVEEIEALVEDLTKACQKCHSIVRATIGRVVADQRSFRRAEFDHRAHIVQLRCLDCHTAIPFAELLEGTEDVDRELDRSEIVNLPSIESCRECHNPEQSTSRCTSCHLFHADKSRHSNLLLYLDEPSRNAEP